ncbi:hypothetical protein KOW79_020410 [Hemibagrus wyckioides]|uniref:MICAL-like protein 2 n=1 Tax=Hemibagrus wyckioides TaxID=337641 RepID=A0A9D3SE62_9TELE|nr:hypothetical protein KOW79_020410 [Hemibagrus wyckioides]
MAAVKALQQWCKIRCEGYRDVSITNMTTSFRDGLAFCALIHKHRPDLIDFDSLNKENIYENNQLAFRVAEEQLSIPALLDAEDMVALKVPDRLSILTYVSQYYNYFHGRSPIGGLAGVKRPAEEPIDGTSGRKNQPVSAKVFSSTKPETDTKRDVAVERSEKPATINRNCSICNKQVHLVQRHLVDGKLYHRNCFKCSECFNILLSGTYCKPGKEPNTFICKSHQNTQKPPPTQVTPPAPYSQTCSHQHLHLQHHFHHHQHLHLHLQHHLHHHQHLHLHLHHLHLQVNTKPKGHHAQEPTATPTAAPRYKPNTSSHSVAVTVKSPAEQKVPSETPKGPSNSVLRNLEARQSPATAATEKPRAGGAGSAGGAGKGKQLVGVDDWIKDKKREKENDGEKEKAKSVISKFVTDETSRSSSSPSPYTSDAKTSVSPIPAASKTPKTRVLLKPPAIDLELSTSPVLDKSSSWQRSGEKSPARADSTQPSDSKESETAPSDWRSLLKPVAKNIKSRSSRDSTPTVEPRTSNVVPRPWETPTKVSSPSSTASQSTNTSSTKPVSIPSRDSEEDPRGQDVVKDALIDYNVESSPSQKPSKPGFIPREEILKELKEIEMKLDDLEKKGVDLEKQLRQCEEEDQEDVLTNDLMVDWFNLIRSKQVFIRRESELVYIGRSQDLEEEQPNVEAELRKLMEKPERFKTSQDKKREEELMAKLMEIVNDRNAIVDGLDEDRLREEEEDEQLNKMMQNLDIKKEKKKRSSMSRLFSRKNKAES